MANVQITFPDGATKEFPHGITALEVAKSIGPRLASDSLAAKVDGRLVDLSHRIEASASIQFITPSSPEGLTICRHSSADFLSSLKKAGANDAFLQTLRAARQPKPAGGGESKKELSQKQILELLAGDVPSSRVAMLVGERGIDFKPTDDYLKTLEGAGAESDLLCSKT